jgi:undecaprenyl-diphosphatase
MVWAMSEAKSRAIFRRMDHYELSLCLLLNRTCRRHDIERLFVWVSRLGDGVFWYALVVALPFLFGWRAVDTSLRMAGVGAAGVLLYKALKVTMVRQRPFITHAAIRHGTPPLDYYSFPSGHTLHAFGFSVVAISHYPVLGWVLVPFTLLVALSRVVLGLHYPSDVFAGAMIGTLLAQIALTA